MSHENQTMSCPTTKTLRDGTQVTIEQWLFEFKTIEKEETPFGWWYILRTGKRRYGSPSGEGIKEYLCSDGEWHLSLGSLDSNNKWVKDAEITGYYQSVKDAQLALSRFVEKEEYRRAITDPEALSNEMTKETEQ
jgi:hypothetical protein